MFCRLVALALFVCSAGAYAFPAARTYNLGTSATFSSPQAVCDSFARGDVFVSTGGANPVGYCKRNDGGMPYNVYSSGLSCPANATPTGGGSECQCQSGYEEQAGQCIANQCASSAGRIATQNFTNGWARSPTPDKNDHVGALTYPSTSGVACIAGCRWEFDQGSGVAGAYRSAEPSAQGLYRLSSDYTMRQGNVSCTPGEADKPFQPTQPDKPCPGTLGEFNGKPLCVGTASTPVPSAEGPNQASRAGGQSEASGNPAAGLKPATGEGSGAGGSGRTPSTGTGGNAGGPASAAVGPGGNGTTNKPADGKEQANCGAPGQPKCGIDETGTPRAEKNQFDNAADKYKTDMDSNREKISGASDKGFFEGWRSFWWAPPVVACQPFQLPSILGLALPSVDACAVVEGVRTVMGVLWALAGFIFCMRMVALTIRGN